MFEEKEPIHSILLSSAKAMRSGASWSFLASRPRGSKISFGLLKTMKTRLVRDPLTKLSMKSVGKLKEPKYHVAVHVYLFLPTIRVYWFVWDTPECWILQIRLRGPLRTALRRVLFCNISRDATPYSCTKFLPVSPDGRHNVTQSSTSKYSLYQHFKGNHWTVQVDATPSLKNYIPDLLRSFELLMTFLNARRLVSQYLCCLDYGLCTSALIGFQYWALCLPFVNSTTTCWAKKRERPQPRSSFLISESCQQTVQVHSSKLQPTRHLHLMLRPRQSSGRAVPVVPVVPVGPIDLYWVGGWPMGSVS